MKVRKTPVLAAACNLRPGGLRPRASRSSFPLTLKLRLLLQKLEDQLRLLVGLRQHRDTRLFQHLSLGQIRRFLREVRILNGAARLGQVLAVDVRLLTAAVKRF